jgi:hypothetical protein
MILPHKYKYSIKVAGCKEGSLHKKDYGLCNDWCKEERLEQKIR